MNTMLYCPSCGREEPFTIETVKETYPVKGENIEIDAKVSYCCNCHSEVWNEELDSQNILDAYSRYRQKHCLLTPSQIRAIREKYNLSQSAFARALGLGEKTITRYERGSLQDRAHNGLIALSERPDAFRLLVERNKELLSPAELSSLLDKIDSFRIRTVESVSTNTAIQYTLRTPYTIKAYNCYFGGLNDAS